MNNLDDLLEPLFRHGFTTAEAAWQALEHEEVAGWLSRIAAKQYAGFPSLARLFPDRLSFYEHLMGRLFEKVLRPGEKGMTRGLATKDEGRPDSNSRWVARIFRNLILDELRNLKKLSEGEKRLADSSYAEEAAGSAEDVRPEAGLDADDTARRTVTRCRKVFAGNRSYHVAFVAHFYPRAITLDDLEHAQKKAPRLFARDPANAQKLLRNIGSGDGIETTELRRELAFIFGCTDSDAPTRGAWEQQDPESARACRENLRKTYDRAVEDIRKVAKRGEWP